MEDQDLQPPPLSKSYLAFQTGLYAFALAWTGFRLWIRKERYWWEDLFALLAALACIVSAVSFWLMFWPNAPGIDYAFIWLDVMTNSIVVWFTRISVLLSILRVATKPRVRILIRACLALFATFGAVSFASKMWICGNNPSWREAAYLHCQSTRVYALVQVSTDVISAVILVALPIAMLWDIKLARQTRILVLSIFAMSILSAVASIVHVVFLVPVSSDTSITRHIQNAVDLTVCNLLVTVTFLYRALWLRKGPCIDDGTSFPGANRDVESNPEVAKFTTVNLDSQSLTHTLDSSESLSHGRSTIAWDPAWDNLPGGWREGLKLKHGHE